MILKKTLIIFLFPLLIFSETLNELEKKFKKLSLEQETVMKKAYHLGEPFNYGYTLAAIAWKESACGVYMINLQDPAAGVFHNNINTVMARHKKEYANTNFQRNRIAQMLIIKAETSVVTSTSFATT